MGKKSSNKKVKKFNSAFDSFEQMEKVFEDILQQHSVREKLSATLRPNLLEEIIEEYMLENFGDTPDTYRKMIELALVINACFEEEPHV